MNVRFVKSLTPWQGKLQHTAELDRVTPTSPKPARQKTSLGVKLNERHDRSKQQGNNGMEEKKDRSQEESIGELGKYKAIRIINEANKTTANLAKEICITFGREVSTEEPLRT